MYYLFLSSVLRPITPRFRPSIKAEFAFVFLFERGSAECRVHTGSDGSALGNRLHWLLPNFDRTAAGKGHWQVGLRPCHAEKCGPSPPVGTSANLFSDQLHLLALGGETVTSRGHSGGCTALLLSLPLLGLPVNYSCPRTQTWVRSLPPSSLVY